MTNQDEELTSEKSPAIEPMEFTRIDEGISLPVLLLAIAVSAALVATMIIIC